MNLARVLALFCLAALAQGALGATIWLKDTNNNVCTNSASTNPGGYIGLGGINHNGTGFTLTISNPHTGTVTPSTGACALIAKTSSPTLPNNNVTFTGGSVVPNIVPISNLGPPTPEGDECLDQGSNLVGVTGAGTNVLVDGYMWSVNFSFTALEDGCLAGTKGLAFYRSVTVVRKKVGAPGGNTYVGRYHIFNELNPILEPSTTLLLLAGGLGLGALGLHRRRRGTQPR